MDTDRIIDALNTLPLRELRRVHAAASELIAFIEATQDPDYGRPTEPQAEAKTYRQEFVRCGKAGCKRCSAGGQGHGPYWYAYWSEQGRTRKQYIGKQKPPAVRPGAGV